MIQLPKYVCSFSVASASPWPICVFKIVKTKWERCYHDVHMCQSILISRSHIRTTDILRTLNHSGFPKCAQFCCGLNHWKVMNFQCPIQVFKQHTVVKFEPRAWGTKYVKSDFRFFAMIVCYAQLLFLKLL